MLRATPWLTLAWVMGCTSAERPAPPPRPAPASTPDEEPPSPPPAAPEAQSDGLTWRWTSASAVDEPTPWSPSEATVQTGHASVTASRNPRAGVDVRAKGPGVSWTTHLGGNRSNTAVLAATATAIFVVHFHAIATGAEVAKLDPADGTVQWNVALLGLGSIGHSKYRNDVQAEVHPDGLHVYGWESGGAYVEILDLESGRMIGHTSVGMGLVDLPWVWEGDAEDWVRTPTRFPVDDGVVARLVDGDAARLVLERGETVVAEVALPVAEGELGTGAGLVLDDAIYFVHGSGIATGARLYAIGRDDAKIRWKHELLGVGPVGHSEYFNMLQIGTAFGYVVVYGNEAAGRYLEVVDPATGASLVDKVWTGR